MPVTRTPVFALMLALLALPAAAAENPAARLRTFLDMHGNQSGLPTGDLPPILS